MSSRSHRKPRHSRTANSRPLLRSAWTCRPLMEVLERRYALATIAVTGPGDSVAVDGIVTLREAIISANNNANVNSDVSAVGTYGADTITLPADTYNLSIDGANENAAATGDLDITDSLTLTGAGAATTIISSHVTDRVIDIIGAFPVSISGVTIQDGDAGTDFTGGGGVRLSSTNTTPYTVTFTDCVIKFNTALNGGGINNDDTQNNSLVLVRTTVFDNTATISDSLGGDGGGIVHGPNGSGSLTLTDSIISDNTAAGEDGGILFAPALPSVLTITGSTIDSNTAQGGEGGGITWFGSSFTLTNSTVISNKAATDGGGILTAGGNVTITNSTLSGNRAGGNGGGIASFNTGSLAGPYTLTNVTITNNFADNENGVGNGSGDGGGIFNSSPGTMSLLNTIVAGNTDGGGQAPDFSGTLTSLGHNLIQSTAGATIVGVTAGNIVGQNALLGPLANNGGPTKTHLPLTGSPAIDAGNNTGAPATDQRGIARPQPPGGIVDIGAVEVQAEATGPADLVVSKTGASQVNVGQNLTYTIVVSNAGSSAAQSVSLSDVIPLNTTFVSATQTAGPTFTLTKPAVGGAGTLIAAIGSFAGGGSATFRLVVHVDSTAPVGDQIENTANVTTTSDESNTGNNTASTEADIDEATLGLPTCDITTLNEAGAFGSAVLQTDADTEESNVMLVTGTNRSDVIIIEPRPSDSSQIRVKINGHLAGIFASSNVPRIVAFGLGGNDTIIVNATLHQSATLFGGAGNDFLFGGAGNDQLEGDAGNDHLFGLAGDDTLCGDDGNDFLFGGLGNDTLFGEAGKDQLFGEAGDDLLIAGEGNDFAFGGTGNDQLFGQAGNDQLFGETGNDVVVGGAGNDKLFGSTGRDLLIGGAGSDQLFGEAHDDILIAGSTTFDESPDALSAILAEWTSSHDYLTRINNLRTGDGASGGFTLDSTTVLDDGAADTLWGLGGQDWFLVGTRDKVKDRASGELVN
jgi:uncharacterized repeat protein (TIGR01451 family)